MGLIGISRDITSRVQADAELWRLNRELETRVSELARLNRLEEQLQGCLALGDTFPLVVQHMGRLAPGCGGALYVVDRESGQARAVAAWGSAEARPQVFVVEDCNALARGRPHVVDRAHPGQPCRHGDGTAAAAMCMPLMAEGQPMGLLQVYRLAGPDDQAFEELTEPLAQVVADNLALTWANLKLRETLRAQAMLDPADGVVQPPADGGIAGARADTRRAQRGPCKLDHD